MGVGGGKEQCAGMLEGDLSTPWTGAQTDVRTPSEAHQGLSGGRGQHSCHLVSRSQFLKQFS